MNVKHHFGIVSVYPSCLSITYHSIFIILATNCWIIKFFQKFSKTKKNLICMQPNWTYSQEDSFLFHGGRGKGFEDRIFKFFCSHHVPKFSISFLNFQCVPSNTSLYPISFAQSSALLTYQGEPKVPSSQRNYYFGQPPKFQFLWVVGQSKWPIAPQKKTWQANHLMNRS